MAGGRDVQLPPDRKQELAPTGYRKQELAPTGYRKQELAPTGNAPATKY